MKRNIIFAVIIILVVIGGILFKYGNKSESFKAETLNNNLDKTSEKRTQESISGFKAKVLAGSNSPFLEFNQRDYEAALSSGKIIFLDFYANWCPVCRGEAPGIHSGFEALQTNEVVGFRVNYNDTETDVIEKKLADKFAITYQHTKVILKNGKEVLKDGEVWDKERFLEEINKYL